MKRLFIYLLLFTSPFIALTVFYVIDDPFKVIRDYDSYYTDHAVNPVYLNKDHVGSKNLLHYRDKYKYNSFILGNSRSMFYEVATWKQFLDSGSICYHFDASAETLYGLGCKVKFLDEQGFDLKNVMVIMDHGSLAKLEPGDRQLNINSPLNSKDISNAYFQYVFLKTFFNPKFLFPYIHYKINGNTVSDYMYAMRLLDNKYISYDPVTNEYKTSQVNDEIRNNTYYTPSKIAEFPVRYPNEYAAPVLTPDHIVILREIQAVFKKHNTRVKFVMSPAYDQAKPDTGDMSILRTVFGPNQVYDFSGKNELTEPYTNFYEKIHYRPFVADSVMRYIYTH